MTADFNWGELGAAWWLENGQTLGATDRQVKLACLKHGAQMSNTAAAKAAGYTGEDDSLRNTASKAVRAPKVQQLIALATAEATGTNSSPMTPDARSVIEKMMLSGDQNIRLAAAKELMKVENRAEGIGRAADTDGFGTWRTARDYLRLPGGAAAYIHLHCGTGNPLSNLPLLQDFHTALMRDDPDLWQRMYARGSEFSRREVDRFVADRSYQIDARIKIWREVGVEIDVPSGVTIDVSAEAAGFDAEQPENERMIA
jgi:hypothetical protein